MDNFNNCEIVIPKIETNTMKLFVEHVNSLASTHYYDEKKDKIVNIVGHVGPDHFAHAYTYARIGYEKIKNGSNIRENKKTVRMAGVKNT